MTRSAQWIVLFTLIATTVGCGSDQRDTAPVSGKVTLAGTPVTTGQIMFWPDDGGPPATGQIQSDGTYRLRTFSDGDGAVPGSHKVTIKAVNVDESAAPKSFAEERMPGAAAAKTEWIISPHYSQRSSSGLTAQVNEGENTIDFDLKPRQ